MKKFLQGIRRFFGHSTTTHEILWVKSRNSFNTGEFAIRMRFTKIASLFGFTRTEVVEESFDNWHDRRHGFTYCPNPDAGDGWGALYYDPCEQFKFAPLNTEYLRSCIEGFFAKTGK